MTAQDVTCRWGKMSLGGDARIRTKGSGRHASSARQHLARLGNCRFEPRLRYRRQSEVAIVIYKLEYCFQDQDDTMVMAKRETVATYTYHDDDVMLIFLSTPFAQSERITISGSPLMYHRKHKSILRHDCLTSTSSHRTLTKA
jgi:hypothetical protein